ncbi:Sec-independent protein translocase protein TatB [Neisseria sp. DTU_2020_1000833_1_SI_GRL_NUU_006]|nr:Sec-independent protein translocase protein TatB [Neisseria sp. DTU_2020_1000833_1_SI_GRL_NUU_006]
MFDFGLGELLLVGIVALIVLGPERLPEAARAAGRLIGKLQRLVSSVKQEFNTQVELEELRKAKQEFEAAAAQVRDSLKETGTDMQDNLHDISDGLKPWERLPAQRTPADFGLDEHGNPLPSLSTEVSDDPAVSTSSENATEQAGNPTDAVETDTPAESEQDRAWREYLTGSAAPVFNNAVEVSYIDTSADAPVLHITSLKKQAMNRKRDLRPKFHAKPKLRVRKK